MKKRTLNQAVMERNKVLTLLKRVEYCAQQNWKTYDGRRIWLVIAELRAEYSDLMREVREIQVRIDQDNEKRLFNEESK